VVTDALSKKWAILIIIVDTDFTNLPDIALNLCNLCKSVADMTFSRRLTRMNTDLRVFRIFFRKTEDEFYHTF